MITEQERSVLNFKSRKERVYRMYESFVSKGCEKQDFILSWLWSVEGLNTISQGKVSLKLLRFACNS